MDKALELLRSIIETEEASLLHWDTCRDCKGVPTCDEGRALMSRHIEATLAAKVYLDRIGRAVSFPEPRLTADLTVV